MRPKSVVQAERVYLVSVALVVAATALIWEPLVEAYGVGIAGGSTAFFVGLLLFLVLFAPRGGAQWARWLLVIVSGLIGLSLLWQVGSGQVAMGPVGVVNMLQAALMVVGAVLLFRPAAVRWFARPHPEWEEDA